tara:strand:+ start:875 stop:2044 length:1170 start_codon:yes stop_codon:yes gene_type:complete
LSNTDRNTLKSIGFEEETLFKIIKDLSSSEGMQKEVLNSYLNLNNNELQKNLAIINDSYSIQIDRKNRDQELKKYVVSFNTFLDSTQTQLFIKNLIIKAHEQLQRNVITNLTFEIDSISKIIKTADKTYREAIDIQLKYLEILDRNFTNNKNINLEKSIEILKNNLEIAEAAGFTDIQNQIFLSNLYDKIEFNEAENKNKNKNKDLIDSMNLSDISDLGSNNVFDILTDDKFSLADEVFGFQKNKYINTYDELQSYSSNKPLYLLGSKILKKEIELLESGKFESLSDIRNNLTSSNILIELSETSNASIPIKIEKRKLSALQDLDKAISEKGLFNISENIYLINYYPSSFTYTLILPNRNYLFILSIFLGLILTIIHLIINAAINYKKE